MVTSKQSHDAAGDPGQVARDHELSWHSGWRMGARLLVWRRDAYQVSAETQRVGAPAGLANPITRFGRHGFRLDWLALR